MKTLRLYLDTSVINFLFAEDAPDLMGATKEFFETVVRPRTCDVSISSIVIDEILETPDAKHRRRLLGVVAEYSVPSLPVEPAVEIEDLASSYIQAGIIPASKLDDALHVAIATVHEVDVMVSWNFRHLANVNKERRIRTANEAKGYFYPLRITTPLEVMSSGEERGTE
ncbi:MAG: type II toxin-antitoxin system VapC family toxin [Planctomycetes bacterium]|nr:type II toxin-antitoxin system VapC family toxin [Planctomycetota bacterium]